MGLKTTTCQSLIKARRVLIGSLLTALALIPSMGALKAQEQIMLVATAEQNQWKITVEADSEVWADWNGNGEKDDNELLTSGQLTEQTTASATLKIYGAVKKLSAPSNNIQSIDLEQATSLIEIDMSHNDLEDIDASECESLSVANVSHNQFEWIDFSYNDELTSLDCSHNENLSGLDLPDGLKELRCSNGALSSLSISSLSQLTLLDCSENPLQMMDFSPNGALQYLYLRGLDQIPYYAGGLQISNLTNLVELDFSGSTFTYVECPQSESMKIFNCSNTKLDIFNVAGFPNLEELYASGSMILTLDISQNNKLKKLTCDRTQLKKLDMPTDPQLEYIDIHNNHLLLDGIKKFVEALNDRTGLAEGTLILIDSYEKSELNPYDDETLHAIMDKNWAPYDYKNGEQDGLNPLRPSDMPLSPYVTDQPKIVLTSDATSGQWDLQIEMRNDEDKKSVWIDRNENGEYDEGEEVTDFNKSLHFPHEAQVITVYGNVQNFFCYANSLTALDISQCPDLEILDASDNKLATIDLSANGQLRALTLHGNMLTEVDLSHTPHLFRFYCNKNQLTQLDLSKTPDLIQLRCGRNELTQLDVSMLTQLKYFDCTGNKLTTLDLTHSEDLTNLLCADNQLTALDLTACADLEELTCYNNKIATAIDFSSCTALREVSLFGNQIQSEEMLQTVSSLPKNEQAEKKAFYGIDTTLEPKDGNVVTKKAVATLDERGWICYDFQSGANEGKNVYAGSENVAIDAPRAHAEQIIYLSDSQELLIPTSYASVAIYDATGTLIRSLEGAGRADLSELPAGLYVVTGVAADSTSASAAMTIVKE